MTDNVHDLDAYRKKREQEGTWPPPPGDTLEYWRSRRGAGGFTDAPKDDGPKGGKHSAKDDRAEALWGHSDPNVHPI